MKELTAIGSRLGIICAVAALVLGLVNGITEPRIAELKAEKLHQALSAVAPIGEIGDEVFVEETEGIIQSYYPVTAAGKAVGYVINLKAAGYAGDMKVLASFTADGAVLDARLMDNQETPGLGKEAEKPEYMQKYAGSGADKPVPVKKSQLSQAEVDSISGATITFMGIGKALEQGSGFVKSLGGM